MFYGVGTLGNDCGAENAFNQPFPLVPPTFRQAFQRLTIDSCFTQVLQILQSFSRNIELVRASRS